MAVAGDLLRVTQFFRQGSIEGIMVGFWRYLETSAIPEIENSELAFEIAEAWQGLFSTIQHPTSIYYRTLVEIAPDFLEFGENVFERSGEATGQAAPSYVAIQVKQAVGTRVTRNGYKRIPFVSEDNIAANVLSITPTMLVNLQDFYGNLFQLYPGGGTDDIRLSAVIIGRTNMGTPEAPNYVLDFTKENPVTSVSANKNTHQNSRDK